MSIHIHVSSPGDMSGIRLIYVNVSTYVPEHGIDYVILERGHAAGHLYSRGHHSWQTAVLLMFIRLLRVVGSAPNSRAHIT